MFAVSDYLCIFATAKSPDGGIGRRAGLKHQWSNPCRFDPGSGYEFNSKAIAKHLKTRGLAIFLSSNFPTFSPHLQEFVQRRPIFLISFTFSHSDIIRTTIYYHSSIISQKPPLSGPTRRRYLPRMASILR